MNQYAIVILNRYPDLARNLLSSIRKTHKHQPTVIVICDRHKEHFADCYQYFTETPFIFARNANLGIKYFSEHDIVLCNDDMECVEQEFFNRLQSIAWKYPKCGIMSPLIDGGVGNEMQQYPPTRMWEQSWPNEIAIQGTDIDSIPVCFPCVYIKRNLINEIGMLDESLDGYGFDDNDYCISARKAGFLTMITRSLHIKHGTGGCSLQRGRNWSVSFAKEPSYKSNQEYFTRKHSPQN